jgi:hypothetical protein
MDASLIVDQHYNSKHTGTELKLVEQVLLITAVGGMDTT